MLVLIFTRVAWFSILSTLPNLMRALQSSELATIVFVILVYVLVFVFSVFIGWRIWKNEKETRKQRGTELGKADTSRHEHVE